MTPGVEGGGGGGGQVGYVVEEFVRPHVRHQGAIRCMLRVGDEIWTGSFSGEVREVPVGSREGCNVTRGIRTVERFVIALQTLERCLL